MSARCSWGHARDEGSKQSEGAEQERRVRSSAFPSSLSWDSDSEKETLDGNVSHLSGACCTDYTL